MKINTRFKKGMIPWNKGKELTEEHKKKIGRKGERRNPETEFKSRTLCIDCHKKTPTFGGKIKFLKTL